MDTEAPDLAADQVEKAIVGEDERVMHEGFMREALAMAELALATDETPVGCVFVHNGSIIGRGMNATNRTRNGTRHAELVAIASILSTRALSPLPASSSSAPPTETELPPPPQKRYSAAILAECDLYVTIEPCIMCASLLRQYHIRKVYFGASNERFGGTGGVLRIHEGEAGEGGPEKGYEVSGGWLREEAIMLLRKFYVQENGKAPEPRRKKDRMLKTEVEPLIKPDKGASEEAEDFDAQRP